MFTNIYDVVPNLPNLKHLPYSYIEIKISLFTICDSNLIFLYVNLLKRLGRLGRLGNTLFLLNFLLPNLMPNLREVRHKPTEKIIMQSTQSIVPANQSPLGEPSFDALTWTCGRCQHPLTIRGVTPSWDNEYLVTHWLCVNCKSVGCTPSTLQEPPSGWPVEPLAKDEEEKPLVMVSKPAGEEEESRA